MSLKFANRRIAVDDLVVLLFLLPLTLFFTTELILSWQWRMVHDTPLLHYVAYLVNEHNFILYKDVFETSMPGTFLFHLSVGKLFGYGDFAFRIVDMVWLAALLGATRGIMKNFGRRVAWGGILLFGLSYFQYGPSMSLQRDYLALLPLSLAVFVAISRSGFSLKLRAFVIGILFGLAATIKPHLAIGWPLVLFFLARQPLPGLGEKTPSRFLSSLVLCAFSLMGLLIPVLGVLIWLWVRGSLPYFWEMVTRYLPLHLGLTKAHQTIFGPDRWWYLIKSHQLLGGRALWLIPACLGGFLAIFEARLSPRQRDIAFLLAGLAIIYGIYPVIAGQFFLYHWMPFQYFIIIFSALILIKLPGDVPLSKRLYPIFVLGLGLYLALGFPPGFLQQLKGAPPPPPKNGRVDEIATFLQSRLEPGDKVQPLDWTGGAVHAMLLAEAEVATPYIYDYHFYHHISQPYIQTLRQRFLQDFQTSSPRFVIAIETNKPWVSGVDTTREFAGLRQILQSEYSVEVEGDGYVIYERR